MKKRKITIIVGLLVGTLLILSQVTPASLAAAMPDASSNRAGGIKIAVTDGYGSEGGDIGATLTSMGYSWSLLNDFDLATYSYYSHYDVIFVNGFIGAYQVAEYVEKPFQNFVRGGGSMYFNGSGSSVYVDIAFPGYVNFVFPNPDIGLSQYMEGRIVDPGLANYLNPEVPPNRIGLEYEWCCWHVVESVASSTTVHLRGDVSTLLEGYTKDSPLTVSFRPFADSPGTVTYMTDYKATQLRDLQEMLLKYLVLIPITSDLVGGLRSVFTAVDADITQTNINIINPGQTSPKFSYPLDQQGRLVLGINWAGSELSLSVFKPDGSLYQQVSGDSPPYLIDIENAQAGVWQYQVTGVDVPQNNYPYVVGIGETPGEVTSEEITIFLPLIIR